MRILLATRNRGKLRELERLFEGIGVELVTLDDVASVPEVVEDRDTFEGNARKKARETARASGLPTLADDSGLEVDVLGGAPGVWSARYAGEGASDADNNRKLLEALSAVPPEARTARFHCALAFADPSRGLGEGDEHVAHGTCEGRIVDEPRGDNGFGYDPLFELAADGRTLAELPPEEKARISHRAAAARRMRDFLATVGCVGLLLGCEVYDPALVRPAVDAGPACELSHPPPRPDVDDDPTDVGRRVWALKDVVLNQDGDRWRTIGYDLDGLCSRPPSPAVECVPPARGADPETDGEGGIDNAFGHWLYPLVQVTLPTLEADARAAEELGVGAIVVVLDGWNGEPNDSRVQATLLIGMTGTPGPSDGARPDVVEAGARITLPDGSAAPPPAWDGDDWFWVRSDGYSATDPTQPVLFDDNAYVSDGLLVAVLPARVDILFQSTDQAVLVRLTESIAVARMIDGGARVEAMVAGRWPVVDILETAERVGLCEGTGQYRLIEDQLGRIADLRAIAGTGGDGVPCNALSLGASFTGYAAHLAGALAAPAVPNACATAATDGGVPDAGTVDAGAVDAGAGDAGAVDAGSFDAGPGD